MRNITVRQLQNPDLVVLSINRFLYTLKPSSAATQAARGFKIQSKVECQGIVHFEVFESQDLLAMTDESQKIVSFYSLHAYQAQQNALPAPMHQHRNFKKVTDLKRAEFGETTGLLISDKTGEIGFINIKNVDKLPKIEVADEEEKKKGIEFVENGVYKTLYGHQETCLGMQMSDDSKYLVSCDTLKKVNVTNFPNVFNLQSVLLEHSQDIRDFCILDDGLLATLSDPNPTSKMQDLIVSSLKDAKVINKEQCEGVKHIAKSQQGLTLQKEDGSLDQLLKCAETGGYVKGGPLELPAAGNESHKYFAQLGVGKPWVCITANYNRDTGAIDATQGQDDLHILDI